MNKKLRLAVSGVLLAWLAWRTDWGHIRSVFAHLRLDLWLTAVGLYLATQFVSAVRWQLLARPLGFRRSLPQYVGFYFIGMFFNLLLPTSVGGDVVRAWYLDGSGGQRLAAFLSVFIDRFSGLLILLALACAASLAYPVPLPGWIPSSVWGTAGCAVLGLATLPLLTRWSGRFSRLRRLAGGVRVYLGEPRLLGATTGLSLVVQAANIVVVWLVGLAIAAPVPAGYYGIAVPMVTLLTMLPVSLNGMGVREGGMVLFLAPLGVDEATAVSLAFLWFCVFTAASVCGAAVYLFGNFPRPEESSDEPVGGDPDQGRAGQYSAAA